ncbi:alpha/beta fold hydrolase [Nocardioides sp. YIM 152315]|uniref:alpha/beta fold hydrolase n=1 Tax=Nocardioides sp. YIM 152315 TaxID=3031760 RepID=UPI0023DA2970|nr:alpha/beta fold hydrolase [Nocardioides sp. YIM 152315]MDF1604512.1 alpha/beta fold hydrolase [Nocardioides sp. YIM 152315]
MTVPHQAIRKGYADSRFGQLHYVETGTGGPPVLMLHQTPRSSDEYRDVLPLVGAHTRAIAMDTVGFGASVRPDEPMSIERFADGVEDLVSGLGLTELVLVGHHTGGVISVEVAARRPDLVRGLVLSGTPYVDAARREQVSTSRPPIDLVTVAEDGSHLLELWQRRGAFYPAGHAAVLNRVVLDALRVIDRVEEGHQAVNHYRMEDRIGEVACPVLVACGELDSFSLPDVPRFLKRLPQATSTVLPDTGVPSVDHHPAAFAAAVNDFVGRLGIEGA